MAKGGKGLLSVHTLGLLGNFLRSQTAYISTKIDSMSVLHRAVFHSGDRATKVNFLSRGTCVSVLEETTVMSSSDE